MKKVRFLVVLLAFLMLAATFVSCGKKPDEKQPNESKTTEDSNNGGDEKKNTPTYVTDDLPETLKYENREFHILCDAQQYGKSFVDVYTGDVINTALYNRFETVQNRLDIDLWIDREDGTYNNMTTFIQRMTSMGADCDLVLAYNLTPASMAINGLTLDLAQTEYLNFKKPWWSSLLIETISVNGQIHFTADNSSWNNLRNMLGIFVDKPLFVANHPDMTVEDLYDMAEENAWTMEKMFELAANGYQDKNGDIPGKDGEDIFGLSIGNLVWTESMYIAAGFQTLQQDENSEWSFNIATPAVVDFIDYFQGKFYGSDAYTSDPTQYKQFKEGRAQFYLSALAMVEQGLEREFAVLPLPMYQQEQGRYYTHFANTYDMYVIPKVVKDKDCSSAVLECLASEAYRQIAPAYFETYLKSQKASDARLPDMYDLIRSSAVFDRGVVFGAMLNIKTTMDNYPIYFVRRALNKSAGMENVTSTWPSVSEQYLNLWKQDVLEITKDN